ncbi:MAG: hypothetical protein GX620_01005 [Chloroflexi bacterium]|nr:hypothetical protein [Chloroflexota bacterium]
MTVRTVQCRPMQDDMTRPVDRDQLSVLVAVVLLGNVLFRYIELPEQHFRTQFLGSPVEIHLTGASLIVVLLVALVCTGTNLILHSRGRQMHASGRPVYIAWILPGMVAGLSGHTLAQDLLPTLWVGGLVLTGFAVALTISAEYKAVSPDAPGYPGARLVLNVLVYMIAFVLFSMMYATRSRSLVTATFAMFVAALLALDLVSIADAPLSRVLIFAGIVGLVIGECTWVLNYWQVSSWVAGLLLLLVFYVITNLAHQHLLDRLSRATLIEFGAVAVIVWAFVLFVGLR